MNEYHPTASGLLIPTRMNEEARYVCNIPGCDWRGYNQREQVAHALTHASDEDLMHELSRSPTEEILGEGDPEYRGYMKRRHAQLLKEVGPREANNPERY